MVGADGSDERDGGPGSEHSLLREAVEAFRCSYAIFDPQRRLVDHSASYAELHRSAFASGAPALDYDALMREAIRQTWPDADAPAHAAELKRRIASHEADGPEAFDSLYPGGRWMRVEKHRLSGGHVAGLAFDITGLKEREAAIAASEARYRALVDTAPVGIWHLDEDGRTLFANARFAALYNGRIPASLAAARLQLEDGPSCEGPFGFPSGREVPAMIAGRRTGGGTHVLVCASGWLPPPEGGGRRSAVLTLLDITPLKAAQARAEHLAWHDPLTGLGNRAQFQRALQAVRDAGQAAVLLVIDLDHFKAVNDRHGHCAGDALLIEVATRLRAATRPGDVVCRLGGDEFAVVLQGPQCTARTPALAGRLSRALRQAVVAGRAQIVPSASIGHASFPADAPSIAEWQGAADLALYAAKHQGRSRAVRFEPGLLQGARARQSLMDRVPEAIASGRLTLDWQPQWVVPGRALRGVAARVRWPDSLVGPAGEAELAPALAEAGLLSLLDEWVLGAALAQLAAWLGEGHAPPIGAVAMSAPSLSDPAFPGRVEAALLLHQVPASMLEIEVPEAVAVRDLDAVAPVLGQLRAMGVRMALEGFGGGPLGVAQLVALPIGLLKLDRAIVAGLPAARPRAMLRALVALAGSLDIPVLAQGVETDAQLRCIGQEGCGLVEGGLVAHGAGAWALRRGYDVAV